MLTLIAATGTLCA